MFEDYESLVQFKKIYDARREELNYAVLHSSVCQLEYCEIKLCSLFKSYITQMRNQLDGTILTRTLPISFLNCVRSHQHFLCLDENGTKW